MKRDNTLDLIKCVSMLLVISIHLANYFCRKAGDMESASFLASLAYNGLARVSVPLFFMASGAVILGGPYDPAKHVKRISRLVVILVFWNLAYYTWDALYMGYKFKPIKDLVSVFFEPVKPHLWFMYPVIGLYVVAPFMRKMLSGMDTKLENLFLSLWAVFSGAVFVAKTILERYNFETSVSYPIPLVQGTYWLGYFVFGYVLHKRLSADENPKRWNKIAAAAYLVGTLATFAGAYLFSRADGKYNGDFHAYKSLFAMASAGGIFALAVINRERLMRPLVRKAVEVVVPCSFGIYLSHILFCNVLVREFAVLEHNGAYAVPTLTAVLFTVSFAFTFIVKKVPILNKLV